MRTTIRLSPVAVLPILFLVAAPAARAQFVKGFAGGVNIAGPSLSFPNEVHQTFRPGFAATVFIGTQTSRRLAARFDVSISRFSIWRSNSVMVLCASPDGCNDMAYAPVGVAALTVNGVMTLNPLDRGGQVYLIAGIGPHYIYQDPDAGGAVRFGASAGAGWVISGRGQRLFVEARYQRLLRSVGQPATQFSWMLPVTMGLRF